jgi:hypothetical protein
MTGVMNCIRLQLTAAMLAMACVTSMSGAQTTQPVEAPPAVLDPAPTVIAPPAQALTWSETVEVIGKATERGDVTSVAAMLARDALVRSFERNELAGARMLVDAAAGWKLLGAHAYEFPPPTLASDIAADVKSANFVADEEKRKIVPLDDAEAARANNTAADWVAQTLGAERDQLVGVAVFWNLKANRPMFVLMKGQRSGESYLVKQAVYGDPMARRATAAAR